MEIVEIEIKTIKTIKTHPNVKVINRHIYRTKKPFIKKYKLESAAIKKKIGI